VAAKYAVKKEDTWAVIAKRFGIEASALAAHNGRAVGDPVQSGEVIEIPHVDDELLSLGFEDQIIRLRELTKKLVTDAGMRKAFLRNPGEVLHEEGVKMDPKLLPSDFPMLRLLEDPTFQKLVEARDKKKLASYIREKHPESIFPFEIVLAPVTPVVVDLPVEIAVEVGTA
jgi:hypothetical protein